ncbi:hypothetical protein ACFW2X_04855 [Streptomyces antibioticus]|uniref:hypothetical protein n=1 Tax=Streptomyces antibioticus TaxID=1890 RepID=UPI0036B7A1C2
MLGRIGAYAALTPLMARVAAAEAAWEQTRGAKELDAAIEARRAVLEGPWIAHRGLEDEHAFVLMRCARLLISRASHRKDRTRSQRLADIDEALACLTRACRLASSRHLPGLNVELGGCHQARYFLTREASDLDRAACVYGHVLAEDSASSDLSERQNRLTATLSLAEVRHERYFLLREAADLDAVIRLAQRLHGSQDADPFQRLRALAILGDAYVDRVERSMAAEQETLSDLDAAIGYYNTALRMALPDAPDRQRILENQAYAYELRYRSTRSLADLDRQIGLLTDLVQAGA